MGSPYGYLPDEQYFTQSRICRILSVGVNFLILIIKKLPRDKWLLFADGIHEWMTRKLES